MYDLINARQLDLMLKKSGRVLSFGTAQYGALGHGYDAGKQLSDCLRPRYIDALKNEKVICVSAGELHSGCVTADGDVYTCESSPLVVI
jgi:alpha-tubulin suppressor-like RCC1 family protein